MLACDKQWGSTSGAEGWSPSKGSQLVALRQARDDAPGHPKGIKGDSRKRVTGPAQLKCLYANARSLGNKHDKLRATAT